MIQFGGHSSDIKTKTKQILNKQLNSIYFLIKGASSGVSFALSSIFAVLLFSAMQMYKPFFATETNTIIGGFLGSWLFVLALTVNIFLYSLTALFNLKTFVGRF